MDDGDGALTLELQAHQIMQNATHYNGSQMCPGCGIIMNPVQALQSAGLCINCTSHKHDQRVKRRMA